ncbi:YfjI family protein [Runella sp.]|uniref:YfjI family protein n=1 Tax=Runella sp. TaxID=1960881 RepID=UPI003D0DF26F
MTNIQTQASRTVEIHKGFDLNQEHPEPQPIKKPLPDVQPLPPEIVPDGLRGWLVDIAHSKQVPLDFPTATALTLISGLVGSRLGMKPKRRDDWLVIPNLWGMIVAKPSMMKTPVINDVSKPLKNLEMEAEKVYKAAVNKFGAATERRKIQIERVKKQLKETDTPELLAELESLMSEDEEVPKRKRYLVNDTTIEKLGVIHNENPAGLNLLRDELAGLLASWEKSGHEQDRAFFLEAWNGNGSMQVDRIGRASLFIPNLCLSVFGGIQPAKLAGYFHNVVNDFGNDGMIQRFQLAVYPDPLPNWEYIDQYPDKEAKTKAYRIFEQLATFDPVYLACADEYEEQPYMRFTEDAQPIFRVWLESLEAKIRSNDLPPLLEEHLGKYRSLVPSLALIFHLIDYASFTADESAKPEQCRHGVSSDALQKAIKFAEYLESHAKRIYSTMSDSGQQAAYQLSKRIAEEKLTDGFTVRDIQQKGWHLLTNNNLINEAVETLISADWLTENKPDWTGGRPPASRYSINPKTRDFYKNA